MHGRRFEKFNIAHECFASPLNVSLTSSSFNSLFYDVDKHFGSQGSFFTSSPLTGTYEVNPPFDPGSVRATYEHIDRLLRKNEAKSKLDEQQCGEYASLPLLFVVVAPRGMDRSIDRCVSM